MIVDRSKGSSGLVRDDILRLPRGRRETSIEKVKPSIHLDAISARNDPPRNSWSMASAKQSAPPTGSLNTNGARKSLSASCGTATHRSCGRMPAFKSPSMTTEHSCPKRRSPQNSSNWRAANSSNIWDGFVDEERQVHLRPGRTSTDSRCGFAGSDGINLTQAGRRQDRVLCGEKSARRLLGNAASTGIGRRSRPRFPEIFMPRAPWRKCRGQSPGPCLRRHELSDLDGGSPLLGEMLASAKTLVPLAPRDIHGD